MIIQNFASGIIVSLMVFCQIMPVSQVYAGETKETEISDVIEESDISADLEEMEQPVDMERSERLKVSECLEVSEYLDGQTLYVLLPDSYSEDEMYPSVYFMPEDGISQEQYFGAGICEKIHSLEMAEEIPEMIYVFPDLNEDVGLEEQVKAAIDTVEEKYSVFRDASMRGVIGTGIGGYLAFLTGYSMFDGEPSESPEYYSAVAGMNGDFTSEDNKWIQKYADLCSILNEHANALYGRDTKWLTSYYTYLDADSDNAMTWEESGMADLAEVYRSDSMMNHHSFAAWDYSVFEYSLHSSPRYGNWMDHLERPLSGFAHLFNKSNEDAAGSENETGQTEITDPEAAKDSNTVDPEAIEDSNAVDSEGHKDSNVIDLMGDWYFCTVAALMDGEAGEGDPDSIDYIENTDWKRWDVVQPGLDWWTEDFADCLEGDPYYAGYAWYVREFDVPQEYDVTSRQIDAGMVDEADEIYINGVCVGRTGIDEKTGIYDGSNPWEEERIYRIPDGLLHTGKNLIAVRVCNGSGGGGWYSGPIRIEEAVDEVVDPANEKLRFYKESFSSEALNGNEIEYRVYLPEGYYEGHLRYPVVYMLHGYGSTGRSFEIAGVPEVLDEGIASGDIPPCIVIFPSDGHPQKASWWVGAYADMVNEDLIAQVDGSLRTVDSRDCRFLAGESMGGAGAWLNALRNPELYGGIFDIYGDMRDTGIMQEISKQDDEQLSKYKIFMICGTHDMYEFDLDHLTAGRYLTQRQIPHVLEIDNGEHSSSFYLPYLKDGFGYLLSGTEPVESEAGEDETSLETEEYAARVESEAGEGVTSGGDNEASMLQTESEK